MNKKGDNTYRARDSNPCVSLSESRTICFSLMLASVSFYCIPSSLLLGGKHLLINKDNLPGYNKYRNLSSGLF